MMFDLPTTVQDPPVRLLAAFQQVFPSAAPEHLIPVPGRELWVAALTNTSREFMLHVPDLNGKTCFNGRSAQRRQTVLRRPLPRWARYPAGVIVHLRGSDLEIANPEKGAAIVIVGDETVGPRYEHALGIAVAALWHELYGLSYDSKDLLEIVEKAHRDYVGN
ncbi:MAG: hypothetical protein SF029_00715 [bacterium]|nr:hypothetical protein [bacterium]